MKIVHLCLASFFPDGYSYQENMLPKFHKKIGFEVEVIASRETFNKEGFRDLYDGEMVYINEFGIKVTRLNYVKPVRIFRKLRKYLGLEEQLKKSSPNIIFIHGCQFLDIKIVSKYLEINPNVKVYVDNHADFSNSATNWLSKNVLHKIIWKKCAKNIEPYVEKFYGVLPSRVDFLTEIYGIREDKCELLVMGADDDLVKKAKIENCREKIREKYNIKNSDFLIITGGKIDKWKTQTMLLMEAIKYIKDESIKLIVFGSVDVELREQFNSIVDGEKIIHVGWINSNDTYPLIESADLGVFPGRHSVLWEQAVGQGLPLIVKHWEGTHHIDLGGNVKFLTNDNMLEIKEIIEEIYNNKDEYNTMKKVAVERGIEVFSYENISRKAIK